MVTPPEVPDLTSHQLQTALALTEYGGFIAAASLLKTSQPAVTRTIKHVEDVLGIKLFDRSTRSVQITAAGKEFVAVAARIQNDLKVTLRNMRELSDLRRRQIIISSIMSVANGKLPGLVSAYRLDHPGIELHVRDGVHGTVIEDVRSGAANFGITYLDDLPDPFLSVQLGREDFTVVLPKNHELARKKTLSLSDLKDVPLVLLPSDSRTRRVIDGAASPVGITLNHVVTVSQFATMLGFVRAGIGLAIAPKRRRCEFPGKGTDRGADPRAAARARFRNHHAERKRVVPCCDRPDVIDQGVMGQVRAIARGRYIPCAY
jgi:DNA-binding transcriptional LysR family regulator